MSKLPRRLDPFRRRGQLPAGSGLDSNLPAPPPPPPVDEHGPPVRFVPGHYYSPMYDARELAERRDILWPPRARPTPDLDWCDEGQLRLCLDAFGAQTPLRLRRLPSEDPAEYYSDNSQFGLLDAWVLAAFLRHLSPRRMIEIGAGFSSLITARVNREELGGAIDFTCIEPYPRDFLRAGVPGISALRIERIQDTPLDLFAQLDDGDVLFIDTSHTVKTGGDVTWIFGEIIPRLRPGVHVHLHDIFLPCEYPEQWIMAGWGWNEQYLVRAFLSYNAVFEIEWGTMYMLRNHRDAVLATFPGHLEAEERIGGSFWIRRRTP